MKKIIATLLTVAMCLTLTIPAIAEDKSLTAGELREYFLEMGIPQSFLENRTDAQLQRLYEKSNGKQLQYVESDISSTPVPAGTIPSADMDFDISILNEIGEDSYGNNTIDAVYVYVYYQWDNMKPKLRHDDAITVNWDPDLFVYGGDFYHSAFNEITGDEYDFEDQIASSNQGGIGYYTPLGGLLGGSPGGNTEFTLYPKTGPLYPAGTYSPGMFRHSLNAQYVHDKTFLGGSISFSYKDFGVLINMPDDSDQRADTYIGHYTYTRPQ